MNSVQKLMVQRRDSVHSEISLSLLNAEARVSYDAPPQRTEPLHRSDCCIPCVTPFVSFAGLSAAVLAALVIIGRSFSQGCEDPCMRALGYQGCVNWGVTLCIASLFFTIPGAAIAAIAAVIEIGRRRSYVWGMALSALFLAAVAASQVWLQKPWSAFSMEPYTDSNGNGVLTNDVLQVYLGGVISAVASVLFLAVVITTVQMVRPPPLRWCATAKGSTGSTTTRTSSSRTAACALALFCPVVLLIVFAASSLSPIWNYSFHSYSAATSTFSLLPATPIGPRNFVFKLYIDTVVFYAWLALLALGGAICTRRRARSARCLSKRLRLPCTRVRWIRTWVHPYPLGVSLGELVLLAAVSTLYAWWVWYWRWGYSRIAEEATKAHGLDAGGICCAEYGVPGNFTPGGGDVCAAPADEGAAAFFHVWARVLGHLTSLSCSLLLLPATKQSVWFHLLGVPFERALKYHRGLGALTYLFVTLHMVLWYLKWAIDSTLFHNIVSTHELKITPAWVHGDNPTVVTSELAWLALTLMIGVSIFGRRRSYELFYYLHVPIGLAFLGAALIHAWSFWYYGAIGLTLFCGDALLRTVHAARADRGRPMFAEFDEASQVTTLRFDRAAFDHFEPAQYIHICVPAISRLERHPFTISSAPSAAERTLHIKAVPMKGRKALPTGAETGGGGTFTAKLARLVQRGGVEALGDVRIDGPLGSAGAMAYGEGFDELVLVAGGIGFTPIHSILAEILIRASSEGGGVVAAAADDQSGGPAFMKEVSFFY